MIEFQKLAVIIPTLDEPSLSRVVKAVQRQMPPSVEIIIAGIEPANRVAKKYNVRFIDSGGKTPKPILLNRIIPQMDAEYFIILDADTIPQAGWAEAMLSAFEQKQELFSGSVDLENGSFWTRVYNLSMLHEFTPEKPAGNRIHIPSGNLGFTRTAYQKIGPFREDIQRSEDFEWTLRANKAGIQPYFLPGAVILHEPDNKNTFQAVMKYWRNSGLDGWRVRQWHADILQTPYVMKYPGLIFIFSPLLAVLPTFRILKTSPALFFRNLELLPFIYLTKLMWCWGLFFDYRKDRNKNG